jgi:hypothetical protein
MIHPYDQYIEFYQNQLNRSTVGIYIWFSSEAHLEKVKKRLILKYKLQELSSKAIKDPLSNFIYRIIMLLSFKKGIKEYA